MNSLSEGRRLIDEAKVILARDLKGAFESNDYNLTVRRAQEVVELTLKGILKILGIDYPKVHDVGILFVEEIKKKIPNLSEELLDKIVEISAWLGETRAPSFYFEKEYTAVDAKNAFEGAQFVFCEVNKLV